MARIISGSVDKNGSVLGGDGFSVAHKDTGKYIITFTTPFSGMPGAAGTEIYPNDPTAPGGNTKDNVIVFSLNNTAIELWTGNQSGARDNRDFSFVVAGD